MSQPPLNIWTIYFNPLDAPGKYVARRFELDKPTKDSYTGDTLESAQEWVIEQFKVRGTGSRPFRMPREEYDEPPVVESWL